KIAGWMSKAHGNRRRFLAYVALIGCATTIPDFSITQNKEFRSLLVDKHRVLARSPFAASLNPATRLYRFVRNDSDYYLDNSAKAVSERAVRLPPNLQLMHSVH